MPSSIEHCSICPFTVMEAGSEAEQYMEQALVQEHLIMLAVEERGHRIYLSEEVTSSRILAARSCANLIKERRCRRFVSLNLQKLGYNSDTVLIVTRHDTEA